MSCALCGGEVHETTGHCVDLGCLKHPLNALTYIEVLEKVGMDLVAKLRRLRRIVERFGMDLKRRDSVLIQLEQELISAGFWFRAEAA